MKLRSAIIGGVIAAALASTTGFCAFNQEPVSPPGGPPVLPPPARLLPEAVIPFPIEAEPEAE